MTDKVGLRLGYKAPNFDAQTTQVRRPPRRDPPGRTEAASSLDVHPRADIGSAVTLLQGKINFYDYIGDDWVILFSHVSRSRRYKSRIGGGTCSLVWQLARLLECRQGRVTVSSGSSVLTPPSALAACVSYLSPEQAPQQPTFLTLLPVPFVALSQRLHPRLHHRACGGCAPRARVQEARRQADRCASPPLLQHRGPALTPLERTGLSCNELGSHEKWVADINKFGSVDLQFPISAWRGPVSAPRLACVSLRVCPPLAVADPTREVAKLYDMLDECARAT